MFNEEKLMREETTHAHATANFGHKQVAKATKVQEVTPEKIVSTTQEAAGISPYQKQSQKTLESVKKVTQAFYLADKGEQSASPQKKTHNATLQKKSHGASP